MNATLDHVREMLRRHTPRLSRARFVFLLFIAALFIWVLMGSRKSS